MKQRLATAGLLLVVWLAVIESVTFGAVLGGVAVCAALVLMHPPHELRRGSDEGLVLRPLKVLSGTAHFVGELVRANFHVARLTASPRQVATGAIVKVDVAPSAEVLFGVLANAVSLTPGTLIVDLDHREHVMFVHVLDIESPDITRGHVLEMQRRILLAFGTERAVAANRALLSQLSDASTRTRPDPEVER